MSAVVRKNRKKEDTPIQKILKSKIFQGIVGLIVIILIFRFAKKTALFVIFAVLTYQIVYYQKLYHLPIDLSPLFFLECVITKYYGLSYTLLFVLIAYLVPKAMVGGLGNWISYVFISIGIMGTLPFILIPGFDLMTGGLLGCLILYLGAAIFQSIGLGKNFIICLSDGIGNILPNIVWFLIFSDVITWVF
ncbi:hypothetical protein HN789_04025 [archaeon]|jgi:hypothetical protein|nr:hypothetical protein [archaeon]MBT4022509.1 hypothetical protein [archaeon]MBT4272348.1 hypothetical protein [archaeon]MBT4460457.1 hypothetical protein [archaeon]MBT4858476.1 hypothetical protein [archaeon]